MDVRRCSNRNAFALAALALLIGFNPALAVDDDEDPPSLFEERVQVIATRLPDPTDRTTESPAHVTVIDREQIARSGVRTLQDLLALEAGAIVYDQVGNDVEKTFDLRGFSSGTGTRVYLDGAPLNDSRNNAVSLDLVPLESLDRVEIIRGSAVALAGGGAEAGVIHLRTRQGEELGGSIALAGGSFDTTRLDGNVQGGTGRFNFRVSGLNEETDGFRENAGGNRRQWNGTAGVDLGGDRRLEFSIVRSTSDLGNPGALTATEIEDDPEAAPFNSVDFSDELLGQASLNFRGTLAGPLTIAANLFHRDRSDESLTTGRFASAFGGFLAELDAVATGATIQVTHNLDGTTGNQLTFGTEYLDGETDAAGFITPADDPGDIDRATPVSLNSADRSTASLFLQDVYRPTARLRLTAGLRFDRDRIGYTELVSTPESETKRFDDVSFRAGVSWDATARHGLYASYGEGFLPPTAEQLFAFPGFGSNPDLVPQDSATFEMGAIGSYGHDVELRLAILRVDTENEIVFAPLAGPFGMNVNAGKIRRDGLEASLRARPVDRLALFFNLTLIDAEFQGGADDGNEVPLVPGERLATGVDLDLPWGLALRADLLYVGEQVLDGDTANLRPKLEAYSVANTRLTWAVSRSSRLARSAADGLSLFAEVRNLFDESYATRGIVAGAEFFTPAPGRRYLLGARWDF